MNRIALRGLALLVVFSVAACGKKGPPQAPLRPVPSAIADIAIERSGVTVTIRFTVPATNEGGSTPPAIDRVDLYGLTLPASAKAPAPGELLVPNHLIAGLPVVRSGGSADTGPEPARLTPGARAVHSETLAAVPADVPYVRYYAAVPMAGRRRGPASAVMALPWSLSVDAPGGVKANYTEQSLTLEWTPASAAHRFQVSRVGGNTEAVLTPEPLTTPTFATRVEFGVERCFVVRAAEVAGPVTVLSAPSAPVCVTAVDRFAPPPPTGLLAVAGDGAVELVWTASSAADVAGYVVLRGEGPSGTLQRLTEAPMAGTQYRDTTAQPGVTYIYAVRAVDRATPPNESEPSNRQTVTARQP